MNQTLNLRASSGLNKNNTSSFVTRQSNVKSNFASKSKNITDAHMCSYCKRMGHHNDSCWRRQGLCLICGSADHRISHCPQRRTLPDSFKGGKSKMSSSYLDQRQGLDSTPSFSSSLNTGYCGAKQNTNYYGSNQNSNYYDRSNANTYGRKKVSFAPDANPARAEDRLSYDFNQVNDEVWETGCSSNQ